MYYDYLSLINTAIACQFSAICVVCSFRTEKNACQWSKDKLHSLFSDLEINDSIMSVQIKELKKCEGEATANNRKAKLIFFYEWELELEWEGRCAGSDQVVKGRVEVGLKCLHL